jgi:hypothetical protein
VPDLTDQVSQVLPALKDARQRYAPTTARRTSSPAWVGDRVAAFAHVLDRQEDGFAHVGQRLFCRLALAVAAGKREYDGDVATFGVGIEHDVVSGLFHLSSLSCGRRWATVPRQAPPRNALGRPSPRRSARILRCTRLVDFRRRPPRMPT